MTQRTPDRARRLRRAAWSLALTALCLAATLVMGARVLADDCLRDPLRAKD